MVLLADSQPATTCREVTGVGVARSGVSAIRAIYREHRSDGGSPLLRRSRYHLPTCARLQSPEHLPHTKHPTLPAKHYRMAHPHGVASTEYAPTEPPRHTARGSVPAAQSPRRSPRGSVPAAQSRSTVLRTPRAHTPRSRSPHGALPTGHTPRGALPSARPPGALPYAALPSELTRAVPARPPNNAHVSRETKPCQRYEPVFITYGRHVQRSRSVKMPGPGIVDPHRFSERLAGLRRDTFPEDVPPGAITHPTRSGQLRLLIVTALSPGHRSHDRDRQIVLNRTPAHGCPHREGGVRRLNPIPEPLEREQRIDRSLRESTVHPPTDSLLPASSRPGLHAMASATHPDSAARRTPPAGERR